MSLNEKWLKGCLVVSLLVCEASVVGLSVAVADIWGLPLTVGELAERLPNAMTHIPFRSESTQVLWCSTSWCAMTIASGEVAGLAALPAGLVVGSSAKALPQELAVDVGVAIQTGSDALETPVTSPLSASAVGRSGTVIQSYAMIIPPGAAIPAISIVQVTEKDGELIEVRTESIPNSDRLSVSTLLRDTRIGNVYSFYWIALPPVSSPSELLVVTRLDPACCQ